MPRSALLNVMTQAAMKAGRSLTRDFGEVQNLQVSMKGPADFVSNADRKAEEIVFQELTRSRPDWGLLMEERGEVTGADERHRWIVDPLDGTTNFLHGIPVFAISIALERDGEIVAGVVFNPAMDELYTAEKGGGAFLNDRRIRVASRKSLPEALFGTGIPFLGKGDHARFLYEIRQVMGESAGVRRMGAAALDLAYVAAGRLDGFWERDLLPWDLAAGSLLVREAGGFVTLTDGSKFDHMAGEIACGNEPLHKALVDQLKKAEAARRS
ncbi:inositol monophosphatase family protein [Mangrovibrevibacter kandeliae]|uniref:inositol monophosphatase family protein n=1 Tax=Mangrovibrevibacter kandeliae TaxID=2968473 RepID=UPI002117DF40|nr:MULTISPECIES: inositol monophosphatase family protein [unclassified Aurantimonas]MCQ8783250.1 inositol monophosphatase [Aurantimonas sp. CSK15Z-1]MCW4116235.1 inositol monophosphatase [Aurantimonas sp. MSK8Z-1]